MFQLGILLTNSTACCFVSGCDATIIRSVGWYVSSFRGMVWWERLYEHTSLMIHLMLMVHIMWQVSSIQSSKCCFNFSIHPLLWFLFNTFTAAANTVYGLEGDISFFSSISIIADAHLVFPISLGAVAVIWPVFPGIYLY